jgi:hypothetical protein
MKEIFQYKQGVVVAISPIYPEDGGRKLLRNASNDLPDYTVSNPEDSNRLKKGKFASELWQQ